VTSDFPPFDYQWSQGSNNEDIDGLEAGTYVVTVSDQATCETVLTFQVEQPEPMSFDTLLSRPTCGGGTDGAIELNVEGGTPPYEFNWEGTGFSPDNRLDNLSRGTYSVRVRDANDCEMDLRIDLRELELLLDPMVQAITPPSCNGFSDGSIEVVIDNGQPPYQYDWQDGRGFRSANSLQDLSAGVYQVEVRDANLCQGFFEFDMQDPAPLELDFTIDGASCRGIADGSAIPLVEGGVGGYQFAWSNGQSDSIATDLAAGGYVLTVTDANGCQISGSTEVTEPASLSARLLEVVDLLCNGESTGELSVSAEGGTTPYEFSLDGETYQGSGQFLGLPAGNFTIWVRDAEGCIDMVDATIGEPPLLQVEAGEDRTINLGFSVGLLATPTDLSVDYEWMPSASLSCSDCPNPRAMPVENTTYTITVIDRSGCEATDSLIVNVLKERPIYIPSGFSPNGDGLNDFFTLYGGPGARQIRVLRIFDRWGELIFEGENIGIGEEAAGWDGTYRGQPMNSGVFVFSAEVEFIDDETVFYKGDVTLVR
ncbi:MAG: gliding motility-associated C-terminal domain-containing protein, partial [Saprospiraceae bacterium]|nr:gliding motility-associated C-terminal domain-containing protein [Saprospiraceae bacterium]